MNRRFLGCIAAAALLAFTAPVDAGSKGNDYRIRVVNNSKHTVYRFFATNRDNDSWGRDILPVAIPPGYNYVLDGDDGSGYCVYDLRAETQDGRIYWKWDGVNVCTLLTLTLQ